MELRKVKYTRAQGDIPYQMRDGYADDLMERDGMFHRWADDVTYDDESTFQLTYALVENEEGRIEKIDPVNIRFIK